MNISSDSFAGSSGNVSIWIADKNDTGCQNSGISQFSQKSQSHGTLQLSSITSHSVHAYVNSRVSFYSSADTSTGVIAQSHAEKEGNYADSEPSSSTDPDSSGQ